MRQSVYLIFLILLFSKLNPQKLTGTVKDFTGSKLSFSSIEVKGKSIGTTANEEGRFSLSLSPGSYTIVCQHIGYQRQEKTITISSENTKLDFELSIQQLTLPEVIVKQGEDPAYAIIRNAISKRRYHKDELEKFTTEVYTKGQLRLRDFPKKFFGQKIDFEDDDTAKNKILYLSEAVAKYSVEKPRHSKVEVLATRVSGQNNGFGLSAPQIISFYENNIQIGENLNPRGFISPIAENALNFYRYKYEGAFFEEGRQISKIRVIPKRKFEPLFSGYINIVEDEWRIHSLQLLLTKSSGMELIDSLQLEQLYMPAGNNSWVIKNQVIYPVVKMFGFDAYGNFVNVYSKYDLNPSFSKAFFDNTILKYTDSSNKKPIDYWEETRPLVLQKEEADDFIKKDSLALLRKSSVYLDSIDRIRNKITLSKILISGISISNQKRRTDISFLPLINIVSYNIVEGLVINAGATISKKIDTIAHSRKAISFTPEIRYGFSNQHLNPNLSVTYAFGEKYRNALTIAGGSDVFQFNNQNPVGILGSTVSALISEKNNLKIYEALFGGISFSKSIGEGITWNFSSEWQDRNPLENTTDFTLNDKTDLEFTPNFPLPVFNINITRHQAFIVTAGLRWQPGTKYIEFPDRKISVGSKYPVFNIGYTQGIPNIFKSNIDYSKWNAGISDDFNFKLFGVFSYRLNVGGFITKDKIEIPDYIHYKGNTSTLFTGAYLERFQLIPHYYFSNKSSLQSTGFIEHHFNGFLTNKIPVIKNLKWNLVVGTNALFINNGGQYIEPFIALENIFKIIRADYIFGFEKNAPSRSGIRVSVLTSFLNTQ